MSTKEVATQPNTERFREHRLYPQYVRLANGDPAYALWLYEVDVKLNRYFGMRHTDTQGFNWRAMYDAGVTPTAAAAQGVSA